MKLHHLAAILDGNGRWSAKYKVAKEIGLRQGASKVLELVDLCLEFSIPYLTVFALSVENTNRTFQELKLIINIFIEYSEKNSNNFHKKGIKIKYLGDFSIFSEKQRLRLEEINSKEVIDLKLTLCIAFNYSGQWDIEQSAKYCMDSNLELNWTNIRNNLSLGTISDPDMLLRLGGEKRLSNFLLANLAYTELLFFDQYWPEFNRKIFIKALNIYYARKRNFGLNKVPELLLDAT